jgi:UrcA family protein
VATPFPRTSTFLLLSAATALGLLLAAPSASAQDSGWYVDNNGYADTASGPERVIVTAPRYHRERGPLGGDIISVSLSREVRIDDLDLHSSWGRYELRSRIRSTAAEVCGQLVRQYPVGATGSPPCYEQAVARAMHLADVAIRDARYED